MMADTKLTRSALVERLAWVSHRSWLRQKERDHGVPASELIAEVTLHDLERAEDIVRELEQIGDFGEASALDEIGRGGDLADFAEEFEAYRRVLLRDARRIAESRAWRWGHRLARMATWVRLRRPRTRGAVADLIGHLEAPPTERHHGAAAARVPTASALPMGDMFDISDPVTVVVPVHGAPEPLERCLAALARNTSQAAELVLIDDASNHPAITRILRSADAHDRVTVLRNPRNLGFAHAVNRAVEETAGDVVILNSDTEVTPRWLENLRLSAYSAPDIGTATPLSNSAGTLSIPALSQLRSSGLGTDDVGRLVSHASAWLLPTIPAGSGFCMYIKRRTLDAVGPFDAERFPAYGEETDFCLRAAVRGWRSVLVDSVFVRHDGGASFGRSRMRLSREAQRKMAQLHPNYSARQRKFARSIQMERIRMRIDRASHTSHRPHPRLLLIATRQPEHARPVLASEFEPLHLRVGDRSIDLTQHDGDGGSMLASWTMTTADPGERDRHPPALERIAVDLVSRHAVELVCVGARDPAIDTLAHALSQLAPTVTLAGQQGPGPELQTVQAALHERLVFPGLVRGSSRERPVSGLSALGAGRLAHD